MNIELLLLFLVININLVVFIIFLLRTSNHIAVNSIFQVCDKQARFLTRDRFSTLVTFIILLIIINIPYYIPIRSKYSLLARDFNLQTYLLLILCILHSRDWQDTKLLWKRGIFDLKYQFTSCAFISCFSFRVFIQ